MRKHSSLKQRLLALALTTVILVWAGAITFTYFDAREEFDEVLDAYLAQSASLLVIQASRDLDEIKTDHAPLLHKYSRHVAFQIWENGQVLRLHSANAPASPLSVREHGFSDTVIDGESWRVFSIWDDGKKNLIQVAERTEVRDELAGGIAGNLLTPLLVSLPLLALLLWVSVTRGLHPLFRLTAEVAQREPDNLAPLEIASAPREVAPLIERLNSLFVRIDVSLQKERRFTADAAHELRTPVAGIKAQAQVARAASSDKERIHALDNAILGCDRAAHLIDQLLTLARIDTLDEEITEACQLRALAAEVIAAIAPTALAQGVQIELSEGDEVRVPGSSTLLRILLRNLIENAVRHTPTGTLVQVGITLQQGHPCLSVCDNGPGIAKADLDRIAERFYRPVGTSASGSGLGLSIVKRIAEIHAAELKISPRENGKGLDISVIFNA
ncbi:MAG TPA: ATP-binding protein [Gallionella sp.]|nr:ATP-binding protein [Gallionella sp.]